MCNIYSINTIRLFKMTAREMLDTISNIQTGSIQECLLLGKGGIHQYLSEISEKIKSHESSGYESLQKLLLCYVLYGAIGQTKDPNVPTPDLKGRLDILMNGLETSRFKGRENIYEVLQQVLGVVDSRVMALIPPFDQKTTRYIRSVYVSLQYLNQLKHGGYPYFKFVFSSFTSRVRNHGCLYSVLFSIDEKIEGIELKDFIDDNKSLRPLIYTLLFEILTSAASIGVSKICPMDVFIVEKQTDVQIKDLSCTVPFFPIVKSMNDPKIEPIKNDEYIPTDIHDDDIKWIKSQLDLDEFDTDELTDDHISVLESCGVVFY